MVLNAAEQGATDGSTADTERAAAAARDDVARENREAASALDPHMAALLDDLVNPADLADTRGGNHHADGDASASASRRVDASSVSIVDAASGVPAEAPPPDFQAIVKQHVLDCVRKHADSQPEVEVCGVLVGSLYENDAAAFVYVDDIVIGNHSAGRSSQVTFTAETWQHIDREMDDKHPGKRIVGWYHSHPGFGIFLSEMDLFIQRNFFNAPWQTALVYDPKSKERGLFAWRSGETTRVEFVVDDGSGTNMKREAAPQSLLGMAGEGLHMEALPATPGTTADLLVRLQTLESKLRWMYAACGLLALVAVVWPLAVLMLIAPPANSGNGGSAAKPQAAPAMPALPDLSKLPTFPDPSATRPAATAGH